MTKMFLLIYLKNIILTLINNFENGESLIFYHSISLFIHAVFDIPLYLKIIWLFWNFQSLENIYLTPNFSIFPHQNQTLPNPFLPPWCPLWFVFSPSPYPTTTPLPSQFWNKKASWKYYPLFLTMYHILLHTSTIKKVITPKA